MLRKFAVMNFQNNGFSSVSFSKDHNVEFYKVLKQRVRTYFKDNEMSRFGNRTMYIKTICLLTLYLTPYFVLLFTGYSNAVQLFLWVLMGVGMAGVGLSVMHDANHGAYSKNDKMNKWMGYVIILIGGNDVNWRIQHNLLHHTYTNVTDIDEDIEIGNLMRFSPHKPRLKGHKFQHLYAWFFYSLMTMKWFTTKDFAQIKRYKAMDLLTTQNVTYKQMLWAIIGSKLLYMSLFILVPIVFFSAPIWVSILGFIFMQMTAGFILSAIFQPAHVIPSSTYPMPNDSGDIEADWAVSQLYNTANFSPKSYLFSWYVGGLNYQVEHHLFPNVCHVHYRELSKIVKATAEEFQLPYYCHGSFVNALKEHAKMLYCLGNFDQVPQWQHA